MHRMSQLMLRLLDGVFHLHAPRHRLLLLGRLGRLVDHRLEDGGLAEDVERPGAEVSQHGRGELLAGGLAGSLLHGLLQEHLNLRDGAERIRRVPAVVLREDVDALRHEALGALQRTTSCCLVQRGVADGVLLVVRKALGRRHEQPQDLQVAFEGCPMQGAVLLLLDLALRLIVLVHISRIVLDQESGERLVAVGGGPNERAPLPAVLAARVGPLLDEPEGLLRVVALASFEQL
mmetsp:Transcript_106895/g.312527  ORF Transcript_106895/g.312527 Transcript_106895/m.312527 type:complete len:234 (-) Transcript_106895:180-881(-)